MASSLKRMPTCPSTSTKVCTATTSYVSALPHQTAAPLTRALSSRRSRVNAQGSMDGMTDATEMRSALSSTMNYSTRRLGTKTSTAAAAGNPVTNFIGKVHLAWRIFFPEKQKQASPKEEVKRRLKMVLVADRCGMSPASLSEMKKTIAKALQDFVDIEAEDAIEVSISSEPLLGTVYSVNIPVRRVKPESRLHVTGLEGEVADGITLEWDPTDWNSDPSSRFPMGC